MYLVTGTSSGIGSHIAEFLLSQGKTVVGVSRRKTAIDNPNFKFVQGDLTDESVQDKVAEAVGPKLDGAVFNAGVLDGVTKVANADVKAWEHVFNVNFFSIVSLVKKLLPALKAAHGRAIFVSSGASTSYYQAWGAYGASKAALNHFAASLGTEEPDIVSVAVAPGVVDTEMQTLIRGSYTGSGEMSDSEAKKFHSLHEDKQLVNPKDSGTLYGNLAIRASPDLSTKYLRYNDPELKSYYE